MHAPCDASSEYRAFEFQGEIEPGPGRCVLATVSLGYFFPWMLPILMPPTLRTLYLYPFGAASAPFRISSRVPTSSRGPC